MASVGLDASVIDAMLDALVSAVDYPGGEFWVKLHTGSPGPDGTTNAATETTRQQPVFDPAAGGVVVTNADLIWASVAATETYKFLSFWDDETAGSFLGSSQLQAPRAVTLGDDFKIPAGDLSGSGSPLPS